MFLGASDQIADTATVSFLGSSGNNGDLRLFGFNETVAGINDRSGGGVIEVADVAGEINNAGKTIAAADVSTLTVNATADSFYNGFLRNNSAGGATVITGALSLVKNGAGTLTISQGQQSGNGNQSYSGTTTINAGSVVYANVGTINSPTIVNAGSVGFLTNLNQSLTNGQVISGAGNLVKSGTGTQILSGALAYSGATTVNAGILNITGTTNASHNGAYTVNAGGILLVGNGTGGGILTGNNAITVNAGGVVAFSRNNAYDFAGIVSGAGDVQSRAGATGTILSGANTYSGSTTVFAGSTLGLAGSGASAGGLNVSNGGLLTLDFNLAGSNAAGIVAATAPVNLNGGTLTIAGSGAANTQALGALNLGTALLSGFQGLSPTQTGSGNSAINFNSGAGGLTVSLGAITHSIGGTANIALPASGSVTTSGTAIGGIANGFTTTTGGTTWLAQDGGGVLTPLATFGTDTFGAGINTDVTTTGAGASTNSIRFNTAAANTLTLTGANTVDSGGILVTTAVGANASTITGGTIAGSASAGLTLIQNNTGAGLTISSGVVDNGGATGLTKAGAGTVTLNGSNTYTGATFVSQGTLITLGTTGNGLTTVGTAGTLQIGDGTTNGIFPTNLAPVGGTLTVANATAQTLPAYQGDINLRMLQNGISNPTSFQTGTFQKIAGGTLTINNTLATGNFHPRAGTTVLDTGADVRVGGFSSVGLSSGDNGTLTAKGAGRFTANGDFNVGDVAGTRGTLNIQDQAVATIATFYVGKGVNGIGVVNQTLGSVVNTGGGDWRFGGGGSAADSAAYGIYNLSGGSFQTSRNFQTGSFGIGIFNQTGGNVSITGGTPDTGRFAGSFGLLNVSGGVYTHNTTSNFISGENGVGTVNVSGAGQFIMANVATANIGLALGGASATGTVNLLAGGLIQVGMVRDFDASTATQSNFNFNGGTLRVTTATANAGAFMTGLTAATVYSGGANIDTNGVAITIAQPLIAPGGSGLTAIPVGAGGSGYVGEPIVNITGGGGVGATARAIVVGGVITGFTITNPGTGYTGAPTVTLLGGGATSLGTAGTATIAANATTGGLNKLNTGTLTLTGASTYGGATTITGGSIAVTNTAAGTNLLLPGTSLVLNGGSLALTGAAALANTQTFAGGTTINAPGTVSSTIGAGGTNIVNLGAITRTAGGAADFSGNGVINTLTANTATSILGGWATFGNGNNWAVSAGTGVASGAITALGTYTTNTWAAGNNTDMTTAGTVTNLTTNSVRFNTATPVTVTISGTDTITSGGILIPAAATTAATIFTGGTLATGTNTDLVVNHFGGGTATIASVIAANGTGGLVKAGGGVLILGNVTNTYNGNTVIGAGTLRLGGANNVQIPNGAGKGNVVINAGATLDLNGFDEQINGLSGYGTVTSGINSNKTLTVGDNNVSSTFSGVYLNGTSTANVLTKIGTGTLTLDNIAPGTYTGATNINGGAIKLATPQALANNTTINVNAANGLLFDTTVPVISGLGGNSNFALQTTATSPAPNVPVQLTIGNNNAGGTFTGALTGTGTLIKSGTGIQLLNGTNTNTGGVIVNGGTLVMGGTNSGTSGLMIVNSGTLQVNSAGAIYGASGRNILVATGGVVTAQAFSANSASTGFGTYPTTSFTSLLSRVDQGSTGVLGLQTDGSLQAPITENLDLAAQGSNLSIGSLITGTGGLGNAPVQYTGIITPNQNTFRIGGGTGRLILPNAATLSGANSLVLYGSASTGGLVYLTGKYGFTGQTIVNNGTTYITNLANGGVASSLGASSSAASNLVLNGGTLSYIGAGGSTDRLVTLGTSTPVLDSSGSGAVNFTGTGAAGFLNSGNRTWILQGTNTGGNSVAAAITDSTLIAGTNGTLNHGITTLQKNGNGTWIISGTNSFSGGTNINNGVLQFNSAASIGANSVNGPATILAGVNGAVALGGSLTTGIQATLNRVSPLSAGTVALTADSAEGINFDGGSAGASLPTAYLGAYGNATYTGALTPFGSIYRLGGGGGVLTMPSGGLSGPRQVIIGGGGPIPLAGAFNVVNPGAGFYQNPNLNGQVTLGGTSDYSGGTIISTGSILSATNVAALGSGPLKFQGGVYRAIDTTDITLASDGVSAREIRIGTDTSAIVQTANVDVIGGVSTTFSKTFGILPALGSNQGQSSFTKFGGGSLTLANGINLPTTNGSNTVATNSGTLIIERGTLSIGANPTNFVGNIQVGSNAGGVATLKLVTNNVFGNTAAQYGAANVVDIYNGSKLDLNGYSDTIRNIRGMGSIVNTGAGSPTLTTGTVASENMIWGGNLEGNFVLKRAGNLASQFGTTANSNGIELFNNYNPNFTGKFVADSAMIRFRADGTLGSTSEAFAADKITLNNGAAILAAGGVPLVLGANRGITLGSGGGSIWSFGSVPLVVNGPITGAGSLSILDDAGTVMLGSDNNTWTGGTTINSNAAGRGMLSIGAGGATGSLPAGDVFFNSAAGAARLYVFKTTAQNIPNTINGPGLILQIGSGTTTLSGVNNTGQTTFIGGGKLRADFSGGNQPIGAGTSVQVGAGTFEYVGASGDNIARLGTINATSFGMPYQYLGGSTGDAMVQSTYGGSGTQTLQFSGIGRGAGSTLNFNTNGGVNGVSNIIGFTAGVTTNQVINASFFYNGGEFAAYDQNGFVRAVQATDLNGAADNAIIGGRYLRLTAAQTGQAGLGVPGINFVGAASGFALNAAQTLTLNGNPGTLLKSGGGTAIVGGGAGATIGNNAQELIVRTDTATDVLQVDVPITGTGALTKSGDGQLTLTAANSYTGQTFVNSGSVVVTGNGVLGSLTAAASVRIANAMGSTASVTINSATAVINAGANTAGDVLRIGEGGNGTLTQSAGTVNGSQYVTIGENQGAVGTYNMSGGTLNVKLNNSNSPSLIVGRAGTGTMNISGTASVNILQGGQFQIASGAANPGQFQGLVPNAGLSTGVGTVTQTGGTVTVATNNGVYQSNAIGAVIIGVDGTGTYNLNGGTLITPILARGNGTANFNFGGGTLRAPANIPTLPQSIFNVDLATNFTGTGVGKGTIDTNGNDVALAGPLSGAGGFAKSSAGVLTVHNANNTYAGGTDINAGTIVASANALGTGIVTVGGGSTLQVQGQQTGLLGKFYVTQDTAVTPGVTTGGTPMAVEFASLGNFNAFTAGKALVAAESTAARGKVSVNYLDLGGANGNTALPPQLIALQAGVTFITRLDGKFAAATAGDYTFQGRSDDETLVWVDGQPVLDNNRDQGQNIRSGTIALTAGAHDITIGYRQGVGGGGFSIGVTQPGQGQSFQVGSELNMSNALLSFGSNDLTVGGLAGSGDVQTVAGGTITDNVGAADAPNFSGALIGSEAFLKSGLGKQILSGLNPAFTGAVSVTDGNLEVSGAISGSAVTVNGAGAVLGGDGAVGALIVTSGTVAPGNSGIGSLDSLNFSLGAAGTTNFEIGSPTMYDSLNVAGTVTLGGNLAAIVGAGPFGFSDVFTVINNDGADAVIGTYAGISEGGLFSASGYDFTVSYVGGDGNDVTLTIPEPGSAALLLGGIAMLAGRRRRNNRA